MAKKRKNKGVAINTWIDPAMKKVLEERAVARDLTISHVVREALRQYLANIAKETAA